MSTGSAESRDHSPEDSLEKRASKKRKVLSCYACRNRKMKCDRVYPVCGRCQKTGRADQCTYDPRLLEELTNGNGQRQGDGYLHSHGHMHAQANPALGGHPSLMLPEFGTAPSAHAPSDALAWELRLHERRVHTLERKVAALDGNRKTNFQAQPPSHLDQVDSQEAEPVIKEEMMFRGKGFKTQFYGSTSALSIFTQFTELQTFTREALSSDSSMGRIRTDFKTFRNRRKAFNKEQGLRVQGTDAEIFALLPERGDLDAAVALYFHKFEDCYRILHLPTFRKDYASFWEKPRDETTAGFGVILILLVAVTKCISATQETIFIGDSSADRESASNLIAACDAWLMRQSRKQLTLPFFQTQCLSLFAKRVNCVKLKQDWVNAGDVMRLAMAAGLHRDSSLLAFGKISVYEMEMRRRIWATIAELELQSSIDHGLQSSLCGLHFDTQAPANIPDDSFSPDSDSLAASIAIQDFTDTSYLVVGTASLPLRIHLVHLLNNPTTNLQYADVLHYDNQITSMLAALPTWTTARAATASAMLKIQLQQFLVILHRPYARLAATNPRFNFSFAACVNAPSAIISAHADLLATNTVALHHARNDILRAGISLAQVVYSNSSLPEVTESRHSAPPTGAAASPSHQPDGTTGPGETTQHTNLPPLQIPQLPHKDFLATMLCKTGIELLERARAIFEQKVMRLGTGYMEYWLLSAAVGIMPSTPATPFTTSMTANSGAEDITSRGRKAIDRITNLCFRVLAMQKEPGNEFATSLRSTMADATTPDLQSTVSSYVVVQPGDTPLGSVSSASMPPFIPGASGLASALDEGAKSGMPMQGPWDGTQDMQVDLSGWNFPDFWAFDVGGDF